MRAGERRHGERQWRDGTRPVIWHGEVFDAAWRKPQRLGWWARFVRWLNTP